MGQKQAKPTVRLGPPGSPPARAPESPSARAPESPPARASGSPPPVLPAGSHRLEDVVDYVTYRVAGNGVAYRVVRTVAWAGDDLRWVCTFLQGGQAAMPETEIGVVGELHPPDRITALVYSGGKLVAAGDLAPFLRRAVDPCL